jgi:hypothetical protein
MTLRKKSCRYCDEKFSPGRPLTAHERQCKFSGDSRASALILTPEKPNWDKELATPASNSSANSSASTRGFRASEASLDTNTAIKNTKLEDAIENSSVFQPRSSSSSSLKEGQQDDGFSVFPGGVQRGEIQAAVQFLATHKNYLQPGFQQEFFFGAQQRVAVGKRFTSVQHDKLLELEAVIRGLVEMNEAEEQERERFMERARHPMALAGYYPHDATCYICIDNAAFSARAQSLIDAEMADAAAWMKAESERKAKAARITAERKAHGG